ncbi:hypothetical protein MTR_4g108730 [Medicago truncatula]|uniref:Uncharacterized protein n=1 Tax=Medicago truncatula TaxID=3880 RepID=A0A072UQ52_MEDTR|nr:hypothetical protein MTR_4g108730 [Medicago truncatula]
MIRKGERQINIWNLRYLRETDLQLLESKGFSVPGLEPSFTRLKRETLNHVTSRETSLCRGSQERGNEVEAKIIVGDGVGLMNCHFI